MILLDTNIISEVMRPAPNKVVTNWLATQLLDELSLTSVTLAEIRYGLARISDGKRKLELENRFRIFVERGFGDRIIGFDNAGRAYRKRLLAMGLTPGTEFIVSRFAPMGDPVQIKLRGFSLSLRKDEARVLLLESVTHD